MYFIIVGPLVIIPSCIVQTNRHIQNTAFFFQQVEKSRSKSRSRSRSRTRSRTRSRSRSLTSFSSRSSRLNMSHNLSLSDLMNRSFGPDKAESADDDVEVWDRRDVNLAWRRRRKLANFVATVIYVILLLQLCFNFASSFHSLQVQYYFWGAELSCSSPSHSWRIFHPEDEAEDDLRHLLFLKQATLGVNAIKGERNIVEVTSKDYEVVKTKDQKYFSEAWMSLNFCKFEAEMFLAYLWYFSMIFLQFHYTHWNNLCSVWVNTSQIW